MPKQKTVVVLGGGSAGLTAATTAADLGAKVVFCMGDDPERSSLCVERGCMPSKAMFEPIDVVHHARQYGSLGISAQIADQALGRIVTWKDREISRFRAFRRQAITRRNSDNFVVVPDPARFIDSHTIEAAGESYGFDAAVIASGSIAVKPAVRGLDELRDDLWTSDDLLDNKVLPESLVVIGAGAIGLEFSLRYARLGSAVTVVTHSRVLPGFPPAFGERLVEIYQREGVRILRNREVVRLRRDITGSLVCETDGDDGFEPLVAERVLLATGRRPHVNTLDLAAAGIDLDEQSKLTVGQDMRLAGSEHIFAAGDVLGQRMVVHQAHIEAGIAGENAVDGGARAWAKRANMDVVFSDPEFAYVGLLPEEAKAAGHRLLRASKESRLVGRLHLAGDDLGFGEFIADQDDARLLGAGLLTKDAANLIHLPGYAIEHGHTVHQVAEAEFYHPVKMEIVSGIIDSLCRELGGVPYCRAPE